MKTDVLIDLLARSAGPAPRAVVARRLLPAIVLGLITSAALALAMLGPLPAAMFHTAAPWIKLAYALSLAVAACMLTARLSRPVSHTLGPRRSALSIMLAMVGLGAVSLLGQPDGGWLAELLGRSWQSCSWLLMGVSLPALAGILWAVRGLAPTRLPQVGFASGLLAGAIGASGYALACPESSTSFIALWYTLGMLMTGLVGRTLGPWVLRW